LLLRSGVLWVEFRVRPLFIVCSHYKDTPPLKRKSRLERSGFLISVVKNHTLKWEVVVVKTVVAASAIIATVIPSALGSSVPSALGASAATTGVLILT
jgi:hypothetical protein